MLRNRSRARAARSGFAVQCCVEGAAQLDTVFGLELLQVVRRHPLACDRLERNRAKGIHVRTARQEREYCGRVGSFAATCESAAAIPKPVMRARRLPTA